MEFIGKSRATRRTVVIGGIAAGALAVVDPVCRQAGAATAVGPAPRDDTAYSLHGVTIADPYRPLEDASRADVKAWIDAAKKRLHHNVLAIALANKLARIAWAVLNKERNFECARTRATSPRPA